jgi:hypothetical protein
VGGQASSRDISKARSLRSKDDNNDDGFKSCNGDEAGNGGTATGVHDNSPVRINRSWYLHPKAMHLCTLATIKIQLGEQRNVLST